MNPTGLGKVRKKHLETKSGADYLKYTRARNQSKKATRQAQKAYETKLAKDIKNNNKPFWKYVNSKSKVKSKIPDINVPGTDRKATSDEEKAEVLNKYFKEVFTKEDENNIPHIQQKDVENELKEIHITKEEVIKKLKQINANQSSGPVSFIYRVWTGLCRALQVSYVPF